MAVDAARQLVLRRLADAHDRFAEEEQVLVAEGRYAESQGAHQYAVWVLRAYRAELDDRKPADACLCQTCCKAYAKGLSS